MPNYSFHCEACDGHFEIKYPRDEAGKIPVCPHCKSQKQVYRDYLADNVSVAEPPKTIGSLADKNSAMFSKETKEYLLKKNKTKRESNDE